MAKWRFYLDATEDVDFKTLKLSGRENGSLAYREQDYEFESLRLEQRNLPSPENKTHQEYGRILGVPGFEMLTQDVEQMHLWYLLDDPNLLYNCLKRNLRYWGQLESFLEHDGVLPGFDHSVFCNLKDKVKLLGRFQELYKIGRPLPIDRSVLQKSGAVSEKFIEEVSRKLEELSRDPEKLLQALNRGEVQRFKKIKVQELEQFLSAQEYLDEQDKLTQEEIFAQLNALLSRMELGASEAEMLIQRIFADPNHLE